MSEFKIGDRVRITDSKTWPLYVGLEGTVVDFGGLAHTKGRIWLQLDNDPAPDCGYFAAYSSEIELIDG